MQADELQKPPHQDGFPLWYRELCGSLKTFTAEWVTSWDTLTAKLRE